MYRPAAKAAVILTALAATLAFIPASSASASLPGPNRDPGAGDCAGNLIWHKNVMAGATKIGELDIYYNASTGVNCAKLNHGGPTWGVASDTYMYLHKCQQTAPGPRCDVLETKWDRDNYAYYAGPLKVTANNHCVWAGGNITYQGHLYGEATSNTVGC